MTDKPVNQAPEQSTALYSVYARKNNTTNDFTQIPENQFANAVGKTASNKGEIFYIDASGDVAELAIGSATQVLTVSSGLPVWSSSTPAAMTQIEIQTVSSPVASVVFDNIPSSGYSKFVLVCVNPLSSVAANADNLYIQVSTDNGSTFKTTSGDYYDGTTARTFLTTLAVAAASSTFQYSYHTVEIYGLGDSSRATFAAQVNGYRAISNVSISNTALSTASTRQVAEADNAFRIVTDGGENITSGIFILYGVTEV